MGKTFPAITMTDTPPPLRVEETETKLKPQPIQSSGPIGGKNFSQKWQIAPYRPRGVYRGHFFKKKTFFSNIDDKYDLTAPLSEASVKKMFK